MHGSGATTYLRFCFGANVLAGVIFPAAGLLLRALQGARLAEGSLLPDMEPRAGSAIIWAP